MSNRGPYFATCAGLALTVMASIACRTPKIDPRTKNPCAFLTRAEAESVLGQPAREGRLSFEAPFAICTYRSLDDASRRVEFHLYRPDRDPDGSRDPENVFEDALVASYDQRSRSIERIGDRAFFVFNPDPDPAQTGTLWVMKGGTLFRIRAGAISGHEDWKMAKELARDVVRRLP
jgi:hypothetical protein